MNKTKLIIITTAISILVGVGAFFGVRAMYEHGVQDGRAAVEAETTDLLSSLGAAISEKSEFAGATGSVLKDVPAEVDESGIDTYITNLETLANSVRVDAVKTALDDYLAKWRDFKSTYASKDNNAISAAFDELKNAAPVIAGQIHEIYNEKITTALKALQSGNEPSSKQDSE